MLKRTLAVLALTVLTCSGEDALLVPPPPPPAPNPQPVPVAVELAFTSAPADGSAGQPITPVVVAARLSSGQIDSAFTSSITISLEADGRTATLTGTTTVHATAGIAVFSDLRIGSPGSGYRWRAESGALRSATSGVFTIRAATLAIVSGNHQLGTHNLPLAEPLVVRVMNPAGQGVAGVEVSWAVTSGAGAWIPWPPGQKAVTLPGQAVTRTDPDGKTGVLFLPTLPGTSTSTVSASAAGLQGSPQTFTVWSTGYRIRFGPLFDFCTPQDYPRFDPPEITVPVGAAVEWVGSCDARIVSQSVPPGGEPFDSGLLVGRSFTFVPRVVGVWTYGDAISGGPGGKLIAVPEPPPVPETGIYVANADGSNERLVTAGSRPAWSPDGRRIVFDRSGELQLIDADGTHLTFLGLGRVAAWAPDGSRIAFVNGEGIAVMNADGSGVRTLLSHHFRTDTYAPWDMGIGGPAWSPDGARIAFQHLGDGDTVPMEIFVMNADGSNPRRLTYSPGAQYGESDPAWSPDGTRIVFWNYGYGLATVAASGGVPQTLYRSFPTVGSGSQPTWSPDGGRIAFTTNNFSWRPSIWSIRSAGGSVSVLIADGYHAAWSPDGSRIAFARNREP
jgi:Tol biopolymer transport system component